MATKNNPGTFDCYAAAEPDEPLFILKATDILAPPTVLTWAEAYKNRKLISGSFDERARRKYIDAVNCAKAMVQWFVARKERELELMGDCICRKCKKDAQSIKGYLARVNEKGVPGIWECRPSCDATLSPEQALIAAIEGDGDYICREL